MKLEHFLEEGEKLEIGEKRIHLLLITPQDFTIQKNLA